MRKTKRLILVAIFSVCCFLGINASADDYDFYEEKSFTGDNAEELAKQELEAQLERAKKFGESLDECSDLEIVENETGIITEIEELAEETVETSSEKDKIIENHEANGYVVDVDTIIEDAVITNYSFTVENGIIKAAKVNDENDSTYVGKKLVDVIAEFKDEDVEDYKITYTTENLEENVNVTKTIKTYAEVEREIERLESLGYTVTWKQNNKEVSTTTLVYTTSKSEADIKADLESKYPTKEIKNVIVSEPTEIYKDEYTSNDFATHDEANSEKIRLEGIYDEVSVVKSKTVTDTENVNKIKDSIEVTDELDFNVTTDGVRVENEDKSGYRIYRLIPNGTLISKAQSIEKNFLTKSECEELKEQYNALGYHSLTCTAVTTTTLEKNEDNKYIFNSEKGTSMSWVHLDISVNQQIVLYNEDGTIKERVTGTIVEAPSAWLNKGTANEKTITYKANATADGNRYEYRSSTDSSFSSEDYVTLQFKIEYITSDGVKHQSTVILEGYLKNIFNVCRDANNSRNRGFDLEISITVDADGNEVVNFVTSTVYTFTAEKDAVYADKIVYDEYEYGTKTLYYVEAKNIDYSYVVSYVATDYSLTYTGTTNSISIIKKYFDKDFTINGTKTTYIVRTAAMIVDNGTCGIGDEGEPILPPHTGLNSTIISYNNVAIIEDKKIII